MIGPLAGNERNPEDRPGGGPVPWRARGGPTPPPWPGRPGSPPAGPAGSAAHPSGPSRPRPCLLITASAAVCCATRAWTRPLARAAAAWAASPLGHHDRGSPLELGDQRGQRIEPGHVGAHVRLLRGQPVDHTVLGAQRDAGHLDLIGELAGAAGLQGDRQAPQPGVDVRLAGDPAQRSPGRRPRWPAAPRGPGCSWPARPGRRRPARPGRRPAAGPDSAWPALRRGRPAHRPGGPARSSASPRR